MNIPIRLKLFLAFAVLAIIGGLGGLLSVSRLFELGRSYQGEQDELAAHEGVHDDRIALLSLVNLANRHWSAPTDENRHLIIRRLEDLKASARTCHGCPGAEQAAISGRMDELSQSLRPLLDARSDRGGGADVATLDGLVAIASSIEQSRAQMEDRYHNVLERRREKGKTLLQPSLQEHLALVLGGLTIALILSWAAARSLARPILSLIAAAKRIGSRDRPSAIALPRDRDLAQVAKALNEMAALVAERAREDMRRQLLEHTISSQEEERKRLARELHDELGGSLSALLMEVQSQHSPSCPVRSSELQGRLKQLIAEVHRMAWDLRPSLLDDLGLCSALSRYAEEMTARHVMPVDFQSVGLETGQARLPSAVETVLYRIAQEALNNSARHARARRASVVLIRRGDEAALLVEDDGVGFDVDAVRAGGRSLGLLGMEERIRLAGGNLAIESRPGNGTTVSARIPLGGAEA